MHKRIAIGLFVLIFVLGVAIVFYHQYTDIQQIKRENAEVNKHLEGNNKPVVENTLPPAPAGYKWVSHGDHHDLVPIDAPDAGQGEPHEDEKVTSEIVVKPDWIYDPDREKTDGWDPKLVWKGGGATIDFNYFRDLTEEEQAEYDRLKSMENPEDHGIDVNNEADLRFVAIANVMTKLNQQISNALGTPELDKFLEKYDRLYGFAKNLTASY